jgi:hypothetical protein
MAPTGQWKPVQVRPIACYKILPLPQSNGLECQGASPAWGNLANLTPCHPCADGKEYVETEGGGRIPLMLEEHTDTDCSTNRVRRASPAAAAQHAHMHCPATHERRAMHA